MTFDITGVAPAISEANEVDYVRKKCVRRQGEARIVGMYYEHCSVRQKVTVQAYAPEAERAAVSTPAS
jgi:hypothetical protein